MTQTRRPYDWVNYLTSRANPELNCSGAILILSHESISNIPKGIFMRFRLLSRAFSVNCVTMYDLRKRKYINFVTNLILKIELILL